MNGTVNVILFNFSLSNIHINIYIKSDLIVVGGENYIENQIM